MPETLEKDRLENSIDPEWLEVDIIKPIKVTKKVLIPVYRYPKASIFFSSSKRYLSLTLLEKFLGLKEPHYRICVKLINVIYMC